MSYVKEVQRNELNPEPIGIAMSPRGNMPPNHISPQSGLYALPWSATVNSGGCSACAAMQGVDDATYFPWLLFGLAAGIVYLVTRSSAPRISGARRW